MYKRQVPSIQPFSFEERLAKEKQLEEAGVLKTIGFLESAFLEYIRNDRTRFSAIADQFCEMCIRDSLMSASILRCLNMRQCCPITVL